MTKRCGERRASQFQVIGVIAWQQTTKDQSLYQRHQHHVRPVLYPAYIKVPSNALVQQDNARPYIVTVTLDCFEQSNLALFYPSNTSWILEGCFKIYPIFHRL